VAGFAFGWSATRRRRLSRLRSDCRQALPVFGIPEADQKELLEALDQSLMKSTERGDEEGER
jgi:hypothetical protein